MLTEVQCKNAKPKEKLYKLFDGGGMYLEINTSGSKYWKLKYRYFKKEKKLPLGAYPLVSLKEARERREQAKKLLERDIDPSIARIEAKRQAELKATSTFKKVALEWHETNKHKWSEGHAKSILSRLNMHLIPKLGHYPISSITQGILYKALKEIEDLGIYETTKRSKQYCSQIFRYAVINDKAERDITIELTGVFRTRKVKHHAALDSSKIPEFLEKLHRNDKRLFFHTRMALEIMLLTFTRTTELIEARWEEFDLEKKMWIIPKERMKVKTDSHIVPLSNQVMNLLLSMKQLYGQWEYVFPSPVSPSKPISENTLLYGLYRLGYKGQATGHGFRALALSTIKEKLGYRHEVPDRQLAHAPKDRVDKAYDRAKFLEERTRMMQEWADYVYGLKGEQKSAA